MPATMATTDAPTLSADSRLGSHAVIAARIEVPAPIFVPSMVWFMVFDFIVSDYGM